MKTTVSVVFGGVRRCLTQRRGCGRWGDAPGHVQGRWGGSGRVCACRRRRSPLGWLRRERWGEKEEPERGEGDAGGAVVLLAPSNSNDGKQEVAARVLACGGHAPLPTGVR